MAENRELALVLKLKAEQFQQELRNSQGALASFNNFIKDWKTQLLAAGTALLAIAKSTANYGEEALKSSQRLGLTVEQTTALQHAATLADVPMSTLEKGLKTLAERAVEAANGTGEGARLFKTLGLSATDASGQIKPLDQLFFELQDRLQGTANQAQFLDAGVNAFGKSFLELVPLIRQGSAATKEAMEEGRRFGVVMTRDQAEAADRFNTELKKLFAQLTGIKLVIGNALIPVLTDLIELFRTLGVGTGLGAGLQFVSEQFVRLNVLLKELQANAQFLFGSGKDALNFGQLKDRIAEIEAEGQKKLFELQHPGVLSSDRPATAQTPSAGTAGAPVSADQEKLGKALLEIYQSQFRAGELVKKQQEDLGRLIVQRAQSEFQIAESLGKQEEARGQRIVQSFTSRFQITEAQRTREQAAQVSLAQAEAAQFEATGGAFQQLAFYKQNIVEAQLAQQLNLEGFQVSELVRLWTAGEVEKASAIRGITQLTETERQAIIMGSMAQIRTIQDEASDDIFAGWARGMQRYVRDTQSGFGLAADMARRTAQAMEQGFRTFFFDLFEGKVKGLKDVLKGVLDFVKQLASQIAAQFAAAFILKNFLGGGGGFFTTSDTGWLNNIAEFFGADFTHKANGGLITAQRFIFGGSVMGSGNRDTVAAMLTPGEGVLSRRGMTALDRLNQGISSIGPAGGGPVTVNVYNAPAGSTAQVQSRRAADGLVLDVILRHRHDLGPIFGGA